MISPLTCLIASPLIAALLVVLIPRNFRPVIRGVALLATFISLIFAVKAFVGFDAAEVVNGYKFVHQVEWVRSLGISYYVGVDGINIGLILMGAIVAFAAACVSNEIQTREKEFYILLLVMTGGILGAFASLDLFFFYFFHELALVPTFIMIGVWGRGQNRNYAAYNITLYLSVGALLALIGLIALYVQSGAKTFDMVKLTQYIVGVNGQGAHPLGYGAAPTATAMLHAGVLKKFGLYGLIRLAVPLMPEAAQSWMQIIAVLCLGNIVYCGLVAMRQKDLNLLIGNSSVAHMGFVFLGIASLNLIGITGAVVIMIAHGLLAALTFGLSGYIYGQTKTLDIGEMGGLLRKLPFIGAVLVMAMMAGCGLPGFANFTGEVLVLFGAWSSSLNQIQTIIALAVWGALVIGAVYMLRAIRNVLHGPVSEKWNNVVDAASFWRKTPYALLVTTLLLFGFYPGLLVNKIQPSVKLLLKADSSARERTPAARPAKTAEVKKNTR